MTKISLGLIVNPINCVVFPLFCLQHPHVYSPVIQGNARMMAPPAHAQPGLVSSSATQYGAHEQTHAMYGRKRFVLYVTF